ncbi:MAG: hypothetical protein HYR91_08795 [Flavobacteriia bacterium]|nr:hypothetical protein [Flavobacteriia bacterium]
MKTCDLSFLKSISPGNDSFVIGILQIFVIETPLAISNAQIALNEKKWAEFHAIIHKIKPSIEIIRLNSEAFEVLKQINQFSKEQINLDQIPALFAILVSNLKNVYLEMNEELNNLN